MKITDKYDVIVVGGGAAGIGAGIGAAQAGAKTLLVESGPSLGGAATQKNVLTYCGLYTQSTPSRQAIGGVAEKVLANLRNMGGIRTPVRLGEPSNTVIALIDPEATKVALDNVIQVEGLDLLLHTMLISASRLENNIQSVTLFDDNGPHKVEGRFFVDASGEGDLAAFGGASIRYGNHGKVQEGNLLFALAELSRALIFQPNVGLKQSNKPNNPGILF
ncbi:MAG TPA: FAD-dependent oxidoreductase [Patescibacteria group bacterium]